MVNSFLISATAAAALLTAGCATNQSRSGGWMYDGRTYASYDQCIAAKERSRNRGAVAGAVGGAATGAALGGNVGETALAAGVGALAGSAVGNARRC